VDSLKILYFSKNVTSGEDLKTYLILVMPRRTIAYDLV
jgi:hypothetical protein